MSDPRFGDESRSDSATTQPAGLSTQGYSVPGAGFVTGDLIAGRYRIESYVAGGGMGEIYLARDLTLEVPLALKTIRPEIATDPVFVRRFKQEVLLARSVTHPNVCRIFDIGEDPATGALFLTMEFLRGETLASRVHQHGLLPSDKLLPLASQLADALDAAHRAGIVHRDFKSSNVMLVPSEDGDRPVITDFGLAMMTGGGPVPGTPAEFVGTPAYMSPEQVRGDSLGPACDLYAFGVVLFEMCTGQLPFRGATPLETARAHLTASPPVPSTLAAVNEDWDRAILRLLAKEPQQRFATARDAVLALEGRPHVGDTVRHSLPAEHDVFVGRSDELTALASRLEGSGGERAVRLLTLLGPGGSGKTRLAQKYGWSSLPRWPGGVWFCDLSEARSVEGIVAAVAGALGVALGKGDLVVQLGHALAGRGRNLLILDNFEQVAGHAGETLGRWLSRATETRFLVTSRERLQLREETTHALEPLDPTTQGVELFELRAGEHRSGFRVDPSNRESVQAIVRRLEGLPLSIELAAARLRMLSLEQLHDRLEDRFKILVGGSHGRHAALATTLDWSWDLLHPWERSAVAQASVFEGGFTLEAAEAVIDLSAHAGAPPVLDVVQALLDKSWLRARVALGAPRFEMYVTIQEYAAARLRTEPDDPAGAQVRHGTHFAELGTAESLDALSRHGGVARRNALHLDLDNLLAACHRALARADEPVMVAAYAAAGAALELRGPFHALMRLGHEMLETVQDPRRRGRVLIALSLAEKAVGKLQEAGEHLEAALAIHRQAGDRRAEGDALDILGNLCFDKGRLHEVHACFEASLAIHREVGNRISEGKALTNLASAHLQGRMEKALECFEAGLAIHREVGNRVVEGIALGNLGLALRILGRFDESRAHLEAALAIHRETGNRRAEGITLGGLGGVLADQGRVEEALECYEASLVIHCEVGNRRQEGDALTSLGQLHMELGRMERARELIEAGLAIHREVQDRNFEGGALKQLGILLMSQGRLDEAREYLEAGLVILREVGNRYSQGGLLRQLGELHRLQGRMQEARRCHGESIAILRDLQDKVELAEALCLLGKCDVDEGNLPAARAALTEAEALATALSLAPESDLLRPIEELRRALKEATAN